MKKLMLSALVLAMGFCILSGTILAGEKVKKKSAGAMVGKVEVVKEGEEIKSIKIVSKKATCEVVLDEKGKELAALEGKLVIVKSTKGEDGKLTVTEFKEKTAPVKKEKKPVAEEGGAE